MPIKTEVNYRPAETPERSCAVCVNFIAPDSCKEVSGLIDPTSVSDLFQPQEATAPVDIEAMLFGGGPNAG